MGQIVTATSGGKVVIDGSRGLGDTIAKMTKAVGIKPCGGCKKRQEILNKAVPYRTKVLSTENTEDTERAKAKT